MQFPQNTIKPDLLIMLEAKYVCQVKPYLNLVYFFFCPVCSETVTKGLSGC